MLTNKLIIEFTKIFSMLISYFEMGEGCIPEENEDTLYEFFEALKAIMEENNKKNV